MGLPNGVHHLAIETRDVKTQVEFFTQVCGMELVALYWMHVPTPPVPKKLAANG